MAAAACALPASTPAQEYPVTRMMPIPSRGMELALTEFLQGKP